MQTGLSQLHEQIDVERKVLDHAPADNLHLIWETIKLYFTDPRKNPINEYIKTYHKYVYDIQLYNRLILLSDVIMYYIYGNLDALFKNHRVMIEYCNDFFDDKFQKKMDYLMSGDTKDITNILRFNDNLINTFIKLAISIFVSSVNKIYSSLIILFIR